METYRLIPKMKLEGPVTCCASSFCAWEVVGLDMGFSCARKRRDVVPYHLNSCQAYFQRFRLIWNDRTYGLCNSQLMICMIDRPS